MASTDATIRRALLLMAEEEEKSQMYVIASIFKIQLVCESPGVTDVSNNLSLLFFNRKSQKRLTTHDVLAVTCQPTIFTFE
jgi:hypothetical protein